MAAHWRKERYAALSHDGEAALKAGIVTQSYAEWLADFRGWFWREVTDWGRKDPHLIRLACFVMMHGQTADAYLAEIDLWDALTQRYPSLNTPFPPP